MNRHAAVPPTAWAAALLGVALLVWLIVKTPAMISEAVCNTPVGRLNNDRCEVREAVSPAIDTSASEHFFGIPLAPFVAEATAFVDRLECVDGRMVYRAEDGNAPPIELTGESGQRIECKRT